MRRKHTMWLAVFLMAGLASQSVSAQDTSSEAREKANAIVVAGDIKADVVDGHIIVTLPDGTTRTIELGFDDGMKIGANLLIESSQETEDGETTANRLRGMLVGPDGNQHVIFDEGFGDGAQRQLLGEFAGKGGIAWLTGDAMDLQVPSARFVIGINCGEISEAMKAQLDLQNGLVVELVNEDTPAEAAGIKQYDILLRADDEPLIAVTDLTGVIEKAGEADTSFELRLVRSGEKREVTVRPKERPGQDIQSGVLDATLQVDGDTGGAMFYRLLPGLIQSDQNQVPFRIQSNLPDVKAMTKEMAELREIVEQLREEIRNK